MDGSTPPVSSIGYNRKKNNATIIQVERMLYFYKKKMILQVMFATFFCSQSSNYMSFQKHEQL
jgi:hypothetical protein